MQRDEEVALERLFEQDGRVIRTRIEGQTVLVPFVLAIYLIAHPYADRPHLPLLSGPPREIVPEHWDAEEPLVWARSI